MRCTYRRYLHAQVHGAQERPHTRYKHRTQWSRSTRTTTPGGNPERRARRQQQQPEGGNSARPTPMILAVPEAGNTHQAHPPPSPTHTVYSEHQEPTTQCRTDHNPGTANTTGRQGGEMIGEETTRRQLEPEPDQTPSQHTDYSNNATNRTTSTTTRQRTPSLDRTEYSQNTNYSHIPWRDTNDPEQDPNLSQNTDYSDRTTNQTTNTTPCRRTTGPRPHGVHRPKHGPLQHTSPRGATPRRPGQRPGAGTTNRTIGHENNAAKRARGPRTRSTTVRVKWNIRHRDGSPLQTIHPSRSP